MPDCDSDQWFDISWLKCKAALTSTALGTGGTGAYLDRFIRWRDNRDGDERSWRTLSTNGNPKEVECKTDNGIDGNLTADLTRLHPRNGSTNDTNGRWTTTAGNSVWVANADAGTLATLYSGNYVTYYEQFRIRPTVLAWISCRKPRRACSASCPASTSA